MAAASEKNEKSASANCNRPDMLVLNWCPWPPNEMAHSPNRTTSAIAAPLVARNAVCSLAAHSTPKMLTAVSATSTTTATSLTVKKESTLGSSAQAMSTSEAQK